MMLLQRGKKKNIYVALNKFSLAIRLWNAFSYSLLGNADPYYSESIIWGDYCKEFLGASKKVPFS